VTAADSVTALAEAVAPLRHGPFSGGLGSPLLEKWHEFYVLAGTAAVTLVGLLFLSLSFNLEVLLHDRHAHLLRHARQTLMDFTYVLTVSLFFLVPDMSVRGLGFFIGLMSAIWLAIGLVALFKVGRKHALSARESGMPLRRALTGFLMYAFGIWVGVEMFLTHDPYITYSMIGLVCALLGNASGSSWHLLVEVGKLKIREQHEAESH
jgi:modulator of FtsH protease